MAAGGAPRVVTAAEVGRHRAEGDCWVIVAGHAYDISGFRHPGGWHRIFPEYAGGDATAAFEKTGHSAEAYVLLRTMLVGRVAGAAEAEQAAPAAPALLRAGHDHRPPRDAEPLWSTRCRGFLPARDPLRALPPPYDVLCELAGELPSALADGSVRRRVAAAAPRLRAVEAALKDEEREGVLERAHALYGYIGKACVHGVEEESGARRVPAELSAGWLATAERVGRPPTIDYAGCVLNNWERVDPAGGITPDNIRLLTRFTGLCDEEWFLKTHVIIESEASGAVSALYDGCRAVEEGDAGRLLAALEWVEQAMAHVARDCLRIMFDEREGDGMLCDPHMFFHRFRPYISTWTAVFGDYDDSPQLAELRRQLAAVEVLAGAGDGLPDLAPHRAHLQARIGALLRRRRLCGPSGAMSSLLPACDAFLGVKMSNAELGKMLASFEEYMPRAHREFLESVRRHPARAFVEELHRRDDPRAASLVEHFNACVRRVLDFRWRHMSFIETYIIRPSGGNANQAGTGGTPAFHYLNQHISDTEAAMLLGADDVRADAAATSPPRGLAPPPTRSPSKPPAGLWEVTDDGGFLPTRAPATWAAPPEGWAAAAQLGAAAPAACVPPASFRELVRARAEQLPHGCAGLDDDGDAERARGLVAHLDAAWRAAGDAAVAPPPALSRLTAALAARVGRGAGIGLTETVLYNWRGGGGGGGGAGVAEGGGGSPPRKRARAELGGVVPVHRFLCVAEEEWWLRLHAGVAAAAGPFVAAARRCRAARDVEAQAEGLRALTAAVRGMIRPHDPAAAGGAAPPAGAAVLHRRLRRFRSPAASDATGLSPDTAAACGVYCAVGAAGPLLLVSLGVRPGANALQRYRDWAAGPGGELPPAHRDFVARLRAAPPLRDAVLAAAAGSAVHDLARLELAYNSCVEAAMSFFSRRWELALGCCGTSPPEVRVAWEEERALLMAARLRLLIERRQQVA